MAGVFEMKQIEKIWSYIFIVIKEGFLYNEIATGKGEKQLCKSDMRSLLSNI